MSHLNAVILLSAIGEIARFPSGDQLVGYAGLAGRNPVDERAEAGEEAGAKDGRREIRTAILDVAWAAIDADAHWRAIFEGLEARIGRNRAIVATALYGPGPKGFRPDLDLPQGGQAISGVDEAIRATREQAARGADWIKLYADYRVGPNGETLPTLSAAEMKAIVDTAHQLGRPVAAHAGSDAGVRMAIEAGVDSIEHGTYLDAESITLFKKNGAYLVPTLMAGDFVYRIASGPNNFLTPAQTAKALDAGPKMLAMARRAHEGGVKIAFGTDTGVSAHGDNAGEFALLVKAGLTPLEAVQAATVNALWDISCAMGLDSPWQIRPHHLHERLNSARSDSIDRIYKFYDRRVLLDDPDSVSGARYWAMARPNSFRAAL